MEGVIRLPAGLGEVREVGRWQLEDGGELRVVRWLLSGEARSIVEWARGGEVAVPPEDEWLGGVALEKRETGARRWSTLRRQEQVAEDRRRLAARLDGWQHGLVARAEKLAASDDRS